MRRNNIPTLAGQAAPYGTSRTKRTRRTNAEMESLLDAVKSELASTSERMTIRHLFYRLANNAKAIAKTEAAYSNLCRHLSVWRKAGEIPYSAFVDSTRWYYGTTGFSSVEEALHDCAASYRKNLWRTEGRHVEVWCEKETIASLLSAAAARYGVQVFVCRGFASLSSLWDAAESFKGYREAGHDVHLLYFGDRDPSGVLVDQTLERTFRDTFNVKIDLRRVAVTPEQIEQYNLPTRPTKTGTTHARGFVGESVEIDAMEPAELHRLVDDALSGFIDARALEAAKVAEESERSIIMRLANGSNQ